MIAEPEYRYRATVDRVIDGDTIDFVIDLGFYVKITIRCRLLGVDAPEIRGDEKDHGRIVTEKVQQWLDLAKDITIQTTKTGKYGRWLAVVYSSSYPHTLNECVREWSLRADNGDQ